MKRESLSFGFWFRKMRIYYLNNVRTSRCILFLFSIIAIFFVLVPILSQPKAAKLKYRHVETDDKDGLLSDEDIEKHLEIMEDTRPSKCRDQAFDYTRLEDINDKVSIIIHFSDEDADHMRLTLASIIRFTPNDLYEEIVILDDATKNERLRKHVMNYLKRPEFTKIKLYRSEEREGLGSSRMKATKVAQGSILVFLSAAVVVNKGWLQPLISRLSIDDNIITVPHFDNFLAGHRFFHTDDNLINTFSWSFFTITSESTEKSNDESYKTTVARREVVVVKKKFLESIGGYDEFFENGGEGETFELSLRTWLCAGQVRIIGCSRVAVHNSLRPVHVISPSNVRHIINLWMKDYEQIIYRQTEIDSKQSQNESQQLTIRKNYLFRELNLKCHDFDWFLNNIATEIFAPSESWQKFGKIKAKTGFCLRSASEVDIEMSLCRHHMYDRHMMFELNKHGAIFWGDHCLTVDQENVVVAEACDETNELQIWKFSANKIMLKAKEKLCLTQVSKREYGTLKSYSIEMMSQLRACAAAGEEKKKQTWEFLNY